MKTIIITDISDPILREEWTRLDKETGTFPQMTYEWCRTWWKYFGRGKKLHIVMLSNDEGKAIAIAPLYIDKILIFRVLRSMPYQFGDFYQFIVSKSIDENIVLSKLTKYLSSCQSWSWVRLELIRNTNSMLRIMIDNRFKIKKVSSCVLIDTQGLTWEQYLKKLKSDHRKYIKKYTRKIYSDYTVNFKKVNTENEFNIIWPTIRNIYLQRISSSQSVRSTRYEEALREAIYEQLIRGTCIIYLLYLNGHLAAFNYGFNKNNIYYAWQSSLNIKYKRYHASIMNVILSIQHLINNNIRQINLMAGLYSWKLDLSYDKKSEDLFLLTSPSNNIQTALLNLYCHVLRDKIKGTYHWIIKFRKGKLIKRIRERMKPVSKN